MRFPVFFIEFSSKDTPIREVPHLFEFRIFVDELINVVTFRGVLAKFLGIHVTFTFFSLWWINIIIDMWYLPYRVFVLF